LRDFSLDGVDGSRTETKFTKWSVSLKSLRTAGIQHDDDDATYTSLQ